MQCDQLTGDLAEAASGSLDLDATDQHHVEQCLRCQAEIVQYRKLLRAMRAMRTDILEPDPGLLAAVLAGIEEAGERHAIRSIITGKRAAYLGGIAAATAAGVGSAIVLARRRQKIAA
jgi:hypothetical protein